MKEETPDRERREMLLGAMKANNVKALLGWFPEDIVMMTGCHSCLGMNICLYPVNGEPIVYIPHNEPELPAGFQHRRYALPKGREPKDWAELETLIKGDIAALHLGSEEIGVARDDGQHALPFAVGETPALTTTAMNMMLHGVTLCDATAIFTALDLRKTHREVEAIRRTNAATAAGLRAFYAALEPGRTEAQVAARVEAAIQEESGAWGCRNARGWAFVQAGRNSLLGATYSRSSAKRLAAGELVMLELGACADGYWCDLTRTGCVGRPGKREREVMKAVKEAKDAGIAAVRTGARYEEVDAAARKVLSHYGMEELFPHSCGHHVGFRYHERGPALVKGNAQLLEEGMVLTVEPGVYDSVMGGAARYEDNVVVGPGGAEVLSALEITSPE